MHRVQPDDARAFEALYDRFAGRAYGFALSITRDDARAQDAAQDAFISVWRSRSKYAPERGPVDTWIMGTVRNRSIDALRRDRRHETRRAMGEGLEDVHAPGDLERAIVERDQAMRLRAQLVNLPDTQRDVITLAYFGELSTSEIARELGSTRNRQGQDAARPQPSPSHLLRAANLRYMTNALGMAVGASDSLPKVESSAGVVAATGDLVLLLEPIRLCPDDLPAAGPVERMTAPIARVDPRLADLYARHRALPLPDDARVWNLTGVGYRPAGDAVDRSPSRSSPWTPSTSATIARTTRWSTPAPSSPQPGARDCTRGEGRRVSACGTC